MTTQAPLKKATAGIWQLIPDFDHLTAYGSFVCPVCGSTKPKGDDFVFRPSHPDDVDGFHDICGNCVRQAAAALGWVEQEKFATKARELSSTQKDSRGLAKELQEARDALATVTRENVRLQEAIDDLESGPFVSLDEFEEDEDGS